jgi:di/tricarboxylate transporter
MTFGASFGSALPVSTPPKAIVYGSGLIPMRRIIGAGVVFDVICIAVIWLALRIAVNLNWTPFLAYVIDERSSNAVAAMSVFR